jgi:peptidoglycan/LPS O-acetylase OafA/YrhL
MGFHVNLVMGGFLGVDAFFVLSGFLITNLLLEEWATQGRVDLRRFYSRRVRRLIPALAVALAGYLVLSLIMVFPLRLTSGHALSDEARAAFAGLAYVSNITTAFGSLGPEGLRHLWSLAAEEQFYVLWPPLLLGALWLRRSRRFLIAGLALAVVAVWLHRLDLTLAGAPHRRLYFAPDTTFDPIVLGCLLAVLYQSGHLERAYEARSFGGWSSRRPPSSSPGSLS